MLLIRQCLIFFNVLSIINAIPHDYFSSNKVTKNNEKRKVSLEDSHLVEKEEDHIFHNDRNIIKGGIHYVCHDIECQKVRKFRLSPANDFDCEEDTILIIFPALVLNKTVKERGYLLPYSTNNEILAYRRVSQICRLIKR